MLVALRDSALSERKGWGDRCVHYITVRSQIRGQCLQKQFMYVKNKCMYVCIGVYLFVHIMRNESLSHNHSVMGESFLLFSNECDFVSCHQTARSAFAQGSPYVFVKLSLPGKRRTCHLSREERLIIRIAAAFDTAAQ